MPGSGWEQQRGFYVPPGAYYATAPGVNVTTASGAWGAWAQVDASGPYTAFVTGYALSQGGASAVRGKFGIGYGAAGREVEVAVGPMDVGTATVPWGCTFAFPFVAGPIPAGARIAVRAWSNGALNVVCGSLGFLRADLLGGPI